MGMTTMVLGLGELGQHDERVLLHVVNVLGLVRDAEDDVGGGHQLKGRVVAGENPVRVDIS